MQGRRQGANCTKRTELVPIQIMASGAIKNIFSSNSPIISLTGGTYGSDTSVTINLSKLKFDTQNLLFLYIAKRTSSSSNEDGFAIIKYYEGNAYITSQVGASSLAIDSFNYTNKTLKLTLGSYMTYKLIGTYVNA